MREYQTIRVKQSGRPLRDILLIAVTVLLVLAVVAFLFRDQLLPTHTDPLQLESTTAFALRDIGKMVTQEAFMTRVHNESSARQLIGITFPGTQRRLIFSYDVTVKAGVDFTKAALSVDRTAKTVTITVPEPAILDASVDPESFKVYDETRNIFNANTVTDFNKAIGKMLEEGREYAVEHGLLVNARANAETLMIGFLRQNYPSDEYKYSFVWVGEEEKP